MGKEMVEKRPSCISDPDTSLRLDISRNVPSLLRRFEAAVIIVFFEANEIFEISGEKDPSIHRAIEGTMTQEEQRATPFSDDEY